MMKTAIGIDNHQNYSNNHNQYIKNAKEASL